MYKLLISIIKWTIKNFYFHTFNKKYDIIIFDNLFPSGISPWRTYEFIELIIKFPNSKIVSSLTYFKSYNLIEQVKDFHIILLNKYPVLNNKIFYKIILNGGNSKLFYCLFYDNIIANINFLKKNNIPFCFTLYPGGGFLLYNKEVIRNLNILFSMPNFKGVFVNQNISKNYLINNTFINKKFLYYIPGVPLNLKLYEQQIISEKDFDNEINFLFMANKYTKRGEDKGFDLFEETAEYLLENYFDLKFNIIGDFSQQDLKNNKLSNNFIFHGRLDEGDFHTILNKTHLIISPNAPFKLKDGAFDGFPLASCITAGYFNNAMFMTDYFNESDSIGWVDKIHFCEIPMNSKLISKKIIPYLEDRNLLRNLALGASSKIKEDYSIENQIAKKIDVIMTFFN